MKAEEYVGYDALGLAALVASGQVTASELLEAARARADAVNPPINAIVGDVGEADERAAAPAQGRPFAGVPFLVKDFLQDYAGEPATFGSRARLRYRAPEHAAVTQRFLDAGLVIFGRTMTSEFGIRGVTEPDAFGACRNPWDTAYTPGGSSGGAAAAVAAGIVPAAGANDGGGSIRIPAACCGLVGFKPSRGLTPYGPGTGEPMFGLPVQGVVSRTVRDSAALYDAIVGRHAAAEYLTVLPDRPFLEQIRRPPRRLRIAYCATSPLAPPDPQATEAVLGAARLLEGLGHVLEEVEKPYDAAAVARDYVTLAAFQAAGDVAATLAVTRARSGDFEADTLAVAELARAAGVAAIHRSLASRSGHIRALQAVHATYDVLLTPTIATPPPRVGQIATPPPLQAAARAIHRVRGGAALLASGLLDRFVMANLRWVPFTQVANLTGRPAVSVPLYRTPRGLPLGVQFIGRLGEDGLLLALAAQLEAAAPWDRHFPAPCLPRDVSM